MAGELRFWPVGWVYQDNFLQADFSLAIFSLIRIVMIKLQLRRSMDRIHFEKSSARLYGPVSSKTSARSIIVLGFLYMLYSIVS